MDVVSYAVRSVLLVRVRPTRLRRLDVFQHAFEVRVDDEWCSVLMFEIFELQPFILRGRQFDGTFVQTLAVHVVLRQLLGRMEEAETSATIIVLIIFKQKE